MDSYSYDELVETCDYGCSDNECMPEPQECVSDSDCGGSFYSDNYCGIKNLYKDFYDFKCIDNKCVDSTTVFLVDGCEFGCLNAECLPECNCDSECSEDYYSDNYCMNDGVYHDFHDFSCADDSCQENVYPELVETCDDGCNDGECVDNSNNGGGHNGDSGGNGNKDSDKNNLYDYNLENIPADTNYSLLILQTQEPQQLGDNSQSEVELGYIPWWLIILIILIAILFILVLIVRRSRR